jgi:hypothetical protein
MTWRERFEVFTDRAASGFGTGCGLVLGVALALVIVGWFKS